MNLKNAAISGTKWTTLSSISLVAVQIIKISVLVRFLSKSDFGLIAIVFFVLEFANLFMSSGLSIGILHKQKISKKEYSSIFWLNLLISIMLYLIIIAVAPIVSYLYSEEQLTLLIYYMGLSIVIFAVGTQFKTIEEKELNFKFIALVNITSNIISLIFAIVLAIKGYGVYALVFSALLQYSISNLIFFVNGLASKGLLFHFNFQESKSFVKLGAYQVAGQIINVLNRDVDILMVGKLFGVELLGAYSLAKQLVFKPTQLVYPIFNRVATPVLSKLQDNAKRLKEAYLNLVNVISSVNFLIYLGIIIFANPIVNILYGGQYENIVTLVRILSVYMIIRASGSPIGCLIIATGRTDLGFYWNIVVLAVMPIAIFVGAQYSVEWVAGSVLIAFVILFVPFWYFLVWKMINVPLSKYLNRLIPSLNFLEHIKKFKK